MKKYDLSEMYVAWLRMKDDGGIIKQVLYHETKEKLLQSISVHIHETFDVIAITKADANSFIEGEGLETTKTRIKEVISHEEI